MKALSGLPKVALFLPALLLLAGCDAEALLAAPEQMWLWLAVPLLGFLLAGATLVFVSRKSQIRHWDLASSPIEPGVKSILVWTIAIGAVVAILFIIYNLRLEIDPRQKIWNIGLWLLGTIVGSVGALLSGLSLAEPKTS